MRLVDKYYYMCYNGLRGRERAMRQWSGREVIMALKRDGWYEVNCEGSHHQFRHPTKKVASR